MSVIGRPKAITQAILQKLEHAFAMGCTDKEACIYAGISTSTLYSHQQENKDFMERKDLLKHTTLLKARMTVVKALETDWKIAFKYLERKNKAEFGANEETFTFNFNARDSEFKTFD